mgnify:CR=1 FL=1
MAIEYVGAAYIELNGEEIEVESVTPKRSSMRCAASLARSTR